jgi:vacuolar-type H+-ATPase subunit I/STV1
MSNCLSKHQCTLTSLYASIETKIFITEKLDKVFKKKFTSLLKEASAYRPFLSCPARYYEDMIRDLFIEEGQKLDCVEDLEFVLYRLNYLKFSDFRRAKENFEENAKIVGNIPKENRVKFEQ